MSSRKRKRNDDGSYSAGAKRYRRGSYPYAVAAKYRKRAVGSAGPRGSAGSRAYWGDTWDAASEDQRRRRALMHYRGDGDYRDFLKWGSRGLGAAAGGALGAFATKSPAGAISAGRMGWNAGANFSKYMGWGDYAGPDGHISRNQIISGGDPGQRSIAVNRGDLTGDVIYSHTEFVKNVTVDYDGVVGSSDFENRTYALNPGLEDSFPFLAQLASNFALYEMHGLIFHFKPTTGEGGSNSLGKVLLATDYDPSAEAFTNSQAMENYDYANSAKPSVAQHHGVETARGQRLTNQLYIRTDASTPGPSPPGVKDKVLTDLGLFQVATEGVPLPTGGAAGTLVVGELWVTYTVKLSRASLKQNQELTIANFDKFGLEYDGAAVAPKGVASDKNSIGGLIIAPLDGLSMTYQFPESVVAGTYRITYYSGETGAGGHNAPVTCSATLGTFHPYGGGVPDTPKTSIDNVADAEYMCENGQPSGMTLSCLMKVLSPNADKATWTITWSSTIVTGGTYGMLLVEQVSVDQEELTGTNFQLLPVALP